MKSQVCEVEPGKNIIVKSSWGKKKLADYHLDALKFCEFGCSYCSSNAGLHLQFKKRTLNEAVAEATGQPFDPHNARDLVITYKELVEALQNELSSHRRMHGAGQTLVYSQLTDGFSPVLLKTGTARRILELLITKTKYRIRVLTKNAIIGTPEWVDFFVEHADRFVVGLSIGTLDNQFSQRMEWRTSRPESRVKALHNLQDAGVPTFGMLCPVFPQVVETDELERLIESVRPEQCEHVWTETYNDRTNWRHVRKCYDEGSSGWNWMTRVFAEKDMTVWSRYATELYVRIHKVAVRDGWTDKLRYLLYEDGITAEDAKVFRGLEGLLLQCKPNAEGQSPNSSFVVA